MRLRRHHKISLFVLLAVLVVWAGQYFGWFGQLGRGAVKLQPGQYAIDHFVDGDTIAVDMNGKVQTVRFIGVDTPETHKPNTPVQCYGPAAAAETKQLISQAGNKVRLASDPESTDRDRYDRLLRYVILPDGTNLDEKLIAEGYGFAYVYFPFTKSHEFSTAQATAQKARKGLWGNCHPYQESNGRWQSNAAS